MPLELVTVPCLSDNYAFLVHNAETDETALIDAPEAAPIRAELDRRGWTLNHILITHHHADHVDGVAALRGGAQVIGAEADAHRLPPLDRTVRDGDTFTLCGQQADVLDVSGHTNGHIAFVCDNPGGPQIAFTADSLMALGCGRLFEGTAAQMWESLQKFRSLPGDTVVCSGHEYTQGNARFAESLEWAPAALTSRIRQIDAARASGSFTVPSLLSDELATNPFLNADDPALARAVGLGGADPAEVFAEVRARKDRF